jgi:hypothetical protein
MFGEAEDFFERLFTMSNLEEENFEDFCRLVIGDFESWLESMMKTERTKKGEDAKKGMHRRVMELLQSDRFTKLVDSIKSPILKNRLGLAAVVLTLSRLYLDELHARIMILLDKALPPDESTALSEPEFTTIKLQVNRFVGYGLFKLIERAKSRAVAGDEDEPSLDLKFARSLRIFAYEALALPNYLSDCYDKTQALTNNGFLALLAPSIFDFGTQVMIAVVECISHQAFLMHGNECLSEGKKALQKRLPALQKVFDSSTTSESHIEIPSSRREEMVKFLVERTANAYYGKELKTFRELHTGRKGTEHTANAFRPHIKSTNLVGVFSNKSALAEADVKKNGEVKKKVKKKRKR